MSEPEQRHIVNAFTFELSKVSTAEHPAADARAPREHRCRAVRARRRRPRHGGAGRARSSRRAPPIDMKPSPALSLIKKAPKTLEGRKVGVLVTDGTDPAFVACAANGRREGRRAAAGRRAEDRRRQRQGRQADRRRSSARRRTVDLLRRRRRRGVGRRGGDAREGSGGDRLDSRRVRSPQGDRRPRHRRWGSPKKRASKKTKGSSKWTARRTSRRSSTRRRTAASGIASRGCAHRSKKIFFHVSPQRR